jgi:hypothetical protein
MLGYRLVNLCGKVDTMLSFLRKRFARRRLRPIISAFPRRLAKGWGWRDHYSPAQARRAITDLRLNNRLSAYALAAACQLQELEKDSAMSARDYQRMRQELADLFGLPASFTIKDLRNTRYSSHEPAQETANAGGPPPD